MREPARSDSDARRRYLHYLQQSLACIHASAIWRAGKGREPEEWVALTEPSVIELARPDVGALYLKATQTFHYADHPDYPGERKVVTDEYAYTLSEDAELRSELLAWHWQPARGHPDPHLHIGYPHPTEVRATKWHVPGGRVAFEQVLVFAIEELGAQPVGDRPVALEALESTLSRFRRYATWGVDGR